LAAALFWPFHYERFVHDWERFLEGWGAKAFHAKEFYPGAGPFWWKRQDGTVEVERRERHRHDSKRIPDMIAPHVRQLFVVSFREDEYEAVAPLAWRRRYGGVHRVAAQMMAQSVGFWARRVRHEGEISYICESGDGVDRQVHNGLRAVYRQPRARQHARMASSPVEVKKGDARGLEVADFVAWHWNKYVAETVFATSARRPVRKDIERLLELLHLKGEQIDIRFFTRDRLQAFLIDHGCTVSGIRTQRPFDEGL
jgi:hypothetical protein